VPGEPGGVRGQRRTPRGGRTTLSNGEDGLRQFGERSLCATAFGGDEVPRETCFAQCLHDLGSQFAGGVGLRRVFGGEQLDLLRQRREAGVQCLHLVTS
jgi:hypothetical protein